MNFGSLFAGVGGFDLAMERAGMTPAWSVELDPQCRAVLRRHWPDVPHYEDVHDVGCAERPGRVCDVGIKHAGDATGSDPRQRTDSDARGDDAGARPRITVEPVDLICGGFPCQDYSVAGKRGGLAGDRGALWWEMHRIVAECRPTWVVGENVPGLLSSGGGRDFRTIVRSLVELGYGVTWAVLDSQHFGVAQRRRRLFIVGHLGGVPRPEILALSEGLFGHPAPSREAGQDVAGFTPGSFGGYREGAGTLRTVDPETKGGNHIVLSTGSSVARTLAAKGQRNNADDENFVLALFPADTGPRRLIPRECERLQGFPGDWTAWGVREDGTRQDMADGPRYRMMGNAVTVNVVEWIAQNLEGQ